MRGNKVFNPWAVCKAQQKKHHWSDKKTERCIKKVKLSLYEVKKIKKRRNKLKRLKKL